MPPPAIRPARADEYGEIAHVWMNSWTSTEFEETSTFPLAKLRAQIPLEIEKGGACSWPMTTPSRRRWHYTSRRCISISCSQRRNIRGKDIGRRLLDFTRQRLPEEIYLRCVR
jgi:hypothetical protein